MFLRPRSSVSMACGSGPPSPRQPELGIAESAARQRRPAGADCLDYLAGVVGLERPDVATVDGCHGRHVARAEALETPDLGVLERLLLGLALERLEDALRPARHAGDARAHVHVVPADRLLVVHVVEARDHREVGRGELHHRRHLVERLGRAPAVHFLRCVQRGHDGRAAVRVAGHRLLDRAPQLLRDLGLREVGDHGWVLLEVDRVVPTARDVRVDDVRRKVVALGGALRRLAELRVYGRPRGLESFGVRRRGAERAGVALGQRLRARLAFGGTLVLRHVGLGRVAPARRLVRVAPAALLAHRSMPPRIGSSIATPAIMSAIRFPELMSWSIWRFTKEGSRMCTRAGFAEPSERTKQPSSPRGDSIAWYTSPGGTRKPSVTSLKWWISASMLVASSCRGGSAILRLSVM